MRDNFNNKLANLLAAGCHFIYLSTWEEERALGGINAVLTHPENKSRRELFVWSVTRGMHGVRGAEADTQNPRKALDFIERTPKPGVFVLLDFHPYLGAAGQLEEADLVRRLRELAASLKKTPGQKTLIFLSPVVVIPAALQREITLLELPLPGSPDLLQRFRNIRQQSLPVQGKALPAAPDLEEQIVSSAAGLTLEEAGRAFRRAMEHGGSLRERWVEALWEEKRQVVHISGLLEWVDAPATGFEPGGMEQLKCWLEKRDGFWLGPARRYHLPAPRGILISGLPGCGKSLAARYTASNWKLPLLRLDTRLLTMRKEDFPSSHPGGTALSQALQLAERLAPCVLWVDEIDQAVNHGEGTPSGLSFFSHWLAEKTALVFAAITANDVERLPLGLLQKGRLDEVFFIDLPDFQEREAIFRTHLLQRLVDPLVRGVFSASETNLAALADWTDGYSGAEIEQVVVNALYEAYAGQRSLTMDDLQRAIQAMAPLVLTQPERIQKARQWAIDRYVTPARWSERNAPCSPGSNVQKASFSPISRR